MKTTIKSIAGMILITVSACKGMSDTMCLHDAVAYAERLGLAQESMDRLKRQFLDLADRSAPNSFIRRDVALEIIDSDQIEQVTQQSQKDSDFFSKRVATDKELGNFQAQMRQRIEKRDRAIATNNDALLLQSVSEIEELENGYKQNLKKASASRWFFAGDLLWKYLSFKGAIGYLEHSYTDGPHFIKLEDGTLLSSLSLKHPFYHMVSCHQIEEACGFLGIANMAAITTQVSQGVPPTFDRTRELAEKIFTEKICEIAGFKRMENNGSIDHSKDLHLIPLALILGIDNQTIELTSSAIISFQHEALKKGRKIEATEQLQKKLQSLPVTHIFYNAGKDHWVLLSVVRKNGLSTMYLLDSLNAPLQQDNDIMKLIRFVDELLE
jgi:hypothetical protein